MPIGRWVLHAARDRQRRFPLPPPFLGVNLSVRQLQRPDLLEDVAGARALTGGWRGPRMAAGWTSCRQRSSPTSPA